jgi:hypothetical protein
MNQTLAEYRAKLREAGLACRLRRAWWRGHRVRAVGHPLTMYADSLAAYRDEDRRAFLAGFQGRRFRT